jgi:hypothetical protein
MIILTQYNKRKINLTHIKIKDIPEVSKKAVGFYPLKMVDGEPVLQVFINSGNHYKNRLAVLQFSKDGFISIEVPHSSRILIALKAISCFLQKAA